MKFLYIVCLLLVLTSVVVVPAPVPQPNGPFAGIFNMISSFVRIIPAAVQTSVEIVTNVANDVDHAILDLTCDNVGTIQSTTNLASQTTTKHEHYRTNPSPNPSPNPNSKAVYARAQNKKRSS